MSDYKVYLGPAVICEVERVPGTDRGCVREACVRYHKSQGAPAWFCSTCGAQTAEFSVPNRREKVDHYELFDCKEPFSSHLCDGAVRDEFRVFIPNQRRAGRPTRELSNDPICDAWLDTLSAETIADEMAWFAIAFGPEIAKLTEAYGAGEVRVEWAYFNTTY